MQDIKLYAERIADEYLVKNLQKNKIVKEHMV